MTEGHPVDGHAQDDMPVGCATHEHMALVIAAMQMHIASAGAVQVVPQLGAPVGHRGAPRVPLVPEPPAPLVPEPPAPESPEPPVPDAPPACGLVPPIPNTAPPVPDAPPACGLVPP